VGRKVKEEVGVSINLRTMVDSFIYFNVPDRALARARAIELDFTNDGNEEEDTMCPVCHESTPLHFIYPFQVLIDDLQCSLRK
jgi:hypothetical protein